ncbi:unnamed protein product [Rotaria magnacalcarata]|uniref:3CxxC-type domain-containing protein n=3 Tax=Rotaria magnacalcarata TaxID=392030 RepID=A0A819RW77_9BILA|nr:unnamed protein product [Rotaria magnacalcarata]CAF2157053.1 unnamed protein product [Rotaria magnacalcarata]CAF4050159.1 unnamed protein product [Rotaria magnacalcarata]CAF4248584.1 unnamed protein product [Rotaria magnacalcarata]
MVHEIDLLRNQISSIERIASNIVTGEGIQVEYSPNQDDITYKHRESFTDDDSGFTEITAASTCVSPIHTICDDDYELASRLSDDSKKEFCSDMCLVFHAEFQLTFGRYFTSDLWVLMPLCTDGTCKLPSDALCDVEIAKVRFECDTCRHCWTSMRGQISFFYDCVSHVLYFKLFTQNCDRCEKILSPLWYPEEVCRVIKNVFVIVQQHAYSDLKTPVQTNYYRRIGNPKGQHHGCQSCRDGVCIALAAQELGCKLVK